MIAFYWTIVYQYIYTISLFIGYIKCVYIYTVSLFIGSIDLLQVYIFRHNQFVHSFSLHFTYRSTTQVLLTTLLVCTHPDSCLHSGLGFSHPGVSLDRGCLGHTQVFQVALETRPMVNTGHKITVNKYTAFFNNS